MSQSNTTSTSGKRSGSGWASRESELHRPFLRIDAAVPRRQVEPIFPASPRAGRGHSFVKRSCDLLFSWLALLVFSVPMMILALLIKLTSRGPVFFQQERVGLNGASFTIWKFRSMRIDAEKTTGPVWAKRNDSRRTWLGALMRRTGMDELPQLFNVLRGEMSIVGPRPERPFFVDKFSRELPHYHCRHLVKPGITGWAQIHGCRGDTSIEDRLARDLEYVERRSLLLDLRILLLTPYAICVDPNGY